MNSQNSSLSVSSIVFTYSLCWAVISDFVVADLFTRITLCIYIYIYIHIYIVTWQQGVWLIYTHGPEGVQRPRESADISVKPRARLCYNIYVILSIVMCCIAHSWRGITTLLVRYVLCGNKMLPYRYNLSEVQWGKDAMAENANEMIML